MNKLFTKVAALSVGLAMAIGVGVAIGGQKSPVRASASEEIAYTLNGTTTGGTSGYAEASTITQSNVEWSVYGNTTMNPWRIGGKSLSGVSRLVQSNGAVSSENITKVVLTVGTASSVTVNSLKLYVGTAAGGSQISTVTQTFAASSDITFTRPTGADWTGRYFTFDFNLTISVTSNKFVEFKSAKFYYEESGSVTYKVTYDENGATSGTVPTDTNEYDSGDTVTVKTNSGNLAKTGYTFNGWNTESNGGGNHYNAGTGTFTITEPTTLYAEWSANSYTVSYDINGGSGTTPESETADYNTKIDLPSGEGLTKTGYVFGGWNTQADGQGTNYSAGTKYTVLGDITLYAKWGEPSLELTRVEDTAGLNEGDQIAIVQLGTDSKKAMSTVQNNNNRGATDVTISSAYKFEADDDVQIVTLGKSNGNWTLEVDDGYLVCPSNNNYLRTSTTLDSKAEWTISISSGTATITNVSFDARVLKYNSSNSIFACYSSGQALVSIYSASSLRTLSTIKSISADISASTGDTEWTIENISVTGRFTDSTEDEDVTQYVTTPTISTDVPEITESGTMDVSVYVESKMDSTVNKTQTLTATLTAVLQSGFIPGETGYSDSSETTAVDWANLNESPTGTIYYSSITYQPVGSSAGKYYYNETASTWRFYQSTSDALIISAKPGFNITEITFKFSYSSNGKLIDPNDGSSAITNNTAWMPTTAGRSFEFNIGNTGSATNGQIRFTNIVVKYTPTNDPVVAIDYVATLDKGDTGTFTAQVANATNPSISWTSSDATVIRIDNASTGAYTVLAHGSATITATLTCTEGSATDTLVITTGEGLITVARANEICAALPAGATTDYKVTLSGYIVDLEVISGSGSKYNAITLSDGKVGEEDSEIMVYGVYDTDVLRNYAILNGSVTYKGNLQNYNGTYELKNLELISYIDDAMTYAATSYNSLTATCEAYGPQGITDSQWNGLASTFNGLDTYAKAKLQAATSSYEYSDDIAHWITRYTIIVEQGGKADFMSLGLTPGSSGRIAILGNVTEDPNHTTLIVIVSSILGVAAVGGYFFLRRKKEQ